MEKKRVLVNFIKRITFLLIGLQVLFGLVWVMLNITNVPKFQESQLFLQASWDFVIDEYMGVLYPLLLRGTSLAGNGFCVLLYVLQLAVAFIAYYVFLKSVFGKYLQGKFETGLLSAYVVTFPVILQGHMSVLPYSLASSMMLLMLAQLKKLLRQEGTIQSKHVISTGIFWGIATLLLPDYGVILGMVVVVGFIVCGWKKEGRWKVLLLTLFVTIACTGGVLSLTQTPGSLGRIQKTVGATMLSRFAWPYIERNGFFWSEEVKTVFDAEELAQISLYPERIIYEFGPKLEEYVGKERANELYWKMALDSVKIGKKEAIVAWGRDMVNNVAGPIGIQLQWLGVSTSYAGWNYAQMTACSPAFTKYFVRFSNYGFDFMLILTFIVYIIQKKKLPRGKVHAFCGLTFLAIGIITVWYAVIGNGMQDYLKVMPANIFWCFLPVLGYLLCTEHTHEE